MSYILEDIQSGKNSRAAAELLDRAPALSRVLADAAIILRDLQVVYEKRDVGDDNVYDPDDLDEREESLNEDAAKVLSTLSQLLTVPDLDLTSSASRQHYVDTARFLRDGEAL